ncbi:hypothetical protein PVL29_016819 [Vitis rotundifolia]|nr:hypothetical protein PVL29_016819 [Vitis rotundifolia]
MMYACVLNHLIDYSLYPKMEYTDPTTTGSTIDPSSSSRLAASLPTAVQGPCAACKILRRRCTDKCMLAPYFPPTETLKFIIAHKVFGAGNIVKSLQELPESMRADAVSSMVYEAKARIRDPVYGCAGAINQLQKELRDLQTELAATQADLAIIQCQQQQLNDSMSFPDHSNLGSLWESYWN